MQTVNYKKWLGTFLVVGAGFILLTSLLVGVSLNTYTGAGLLVVGILYLAKPAIEYNDEEIRVKNIFGMVMKQLSVKADKIEVKEGIAYASDKKIFPGHRYLNSDEYAKFISYIESVKK